MTAETEAIARAIQAHASTLEWLRQCAASNGLRFECLYAAFVVEGAAALVSERTSGMGINNIAMDMLATDREAILHAALVALRDEMKPNAD